MEKMRSKCECCEACVGRGRAKEIDKGGGAAQEENISTGKKEKKRLYVYWTRYR